MTKITDYPKFVLLPLAAYQTDLEGRDRNALNMKISDTHVVVSNENGEEIGSVSGCIGGRVELRDRVRGEAWTILPRDLWESFQAAMAARGM